MRRRTGARETAPPRRRGTEPPADMPTARTVRRVRVSSYLLRVQLADRPGSLGSLAVALGSVGADIFRWMSWTADPATRSTISGRVTAGGMPDTLITAAESLQRCPGGQPATALRPTRYASRLALIDHVAAAGDTTAKLQVLVDGPRRCCGSTGAPCWASPTRGSSASWAARRAGDATDRRAVDADRHARRAGRYRATGCHRSGGIWTPS